MECPSSQGTGTAVRVLVPPPKTHSREDARARGRGSCQGTFEKVPRHPSKLSNIFSLCDGVFTVSSHGYCRTRRGIKHLCLIQQQRNVAITAHPKRTPERTRGRGGAVFVRKLFEKSFPTPFKNFHTFFLVSWSAHCLRAQVLPIAVRHRQDPACAPVGEAIFVIKLFGKKCEAQRMRQAFGFSDTPQNFHTFFLVSWSVHCLRAQILPIAVNSNGTLR